MQKYLRFTVFSAGMVTLAAELSASRLLGNVFGTSNLVWASIIGLILVYLAAGYLIGGRWADQSPYPHTMYRILAWGAFTLGLIPLVSQPVLQAAAAAFDGLELGIMFGSFAAVLILFSLPITLLGTISPFAIRLSIQDTRRAGNIAGTLYAISTAGSFVGTFLPVLVLTSLIGTIRTFLVFSLFLLFVAMIGLKINAGWRAVLAYVWMPALIVLALFGGIRPLKHSKGQIYEAESAYNYIQVVQAGEYRYLRLNEGQGVHSIYHPHTLYYQGPWEQFLVGPLFNRPPYLPEDVERIAIVGLAAGTVARQATAIYGPVPIDGYEIDPKIIDVGRKYFDMNMPNLNVYIQDGRWGLEHSPHKYTLIAVDAYRPPYIPWHMTTQEFFQIAHDHLTDYGVLAINIGSVPGDRRLINGLATTMATVFPSIYIMDIPNTFNTIVYATKQPTRIRNLSANLMLLYPRSDIDPLLLTVAQNTLVNLMPGYETTIVFTDDLAPVEWIVNDMVVRFIVSGETDIIQ